ncbi:hypothetical protein [Rubrolithibacter danxiaensis]|uniref:hypothetical protein n=1 Tax=Rubrolithibacter danxiaensis TaxID=3390805 RepID=UPI003BF85E83
MEETFTLKANYKGEERGFEAKLVSYGYSYRFHVDIDGVGVFFEPDEERRYRAILDNEAIEKNLKSNVELVQLVGKKIEELFRNSK